MSEHLSVDTQPAADAADVHISAGPDGCYLIEPVTSGGEAFIRHLVERSGGAVLIEPRPAVVKGSP